MTLLLKLQYSLHMLFKDTKGTKMRTLNDLLNLGLVNNLLPGILLLHWLNDVVYLDISHVLLNSASLTVSSQFAVF